MPELTYDVSGLAPGESLAAKPVPVCDADLNTAGSYPIIFSGAEVPATGNYQSEITYIAGMLTVNPRSAPPSPPAPAVIPVTGVRLTPTSQMLKAGQSFQLTATVEPGDTTQSNAVTWSSSNPAVAAADGSGHVTALAPGMAEITVSTVSGGFTAVCVVTVEAPDVPDIPDVPDVPDTPDVPDVPDIPDTPEPPEDVELKLDIAEGITEVPPALLVIEHLSTPEKLEQAMRTAVQQLTSSPDGTAVYDVELLVSADGGLTWTKATPENFPDRGLTVTLPYPDGTDSSYHFTVVHMFTTADFGKVPGETETPAVTNVANGVRFTVTGLSPISVGWTKDEEPDTPDQPDVPDQPEVPVRPVYPSWPSYSGGGSHAVNTYAVKVEKTEYGTVVPSHANAASGTTVTLTVTPGDGYVLDTLTVTDSRGDEIGLTSQGGGEYAFTMPARAVSITAIFLSTPEDVERSCDGGADCPSRNFADLGTAGTWYHEAVDYVLRNGLMSGCENGRFGPDDHLSRAMLAQVLHNLEGKPVVNYLMQFADVPGGEWYAEAIRWASSMGIITGYGDGLFGPDDDITREQMAVMLWRYAGNPAATEKELHFSDADQASPYALEALRWAVENGILNGTGNGVLDPAGLAARAETAQMLMNYLSRTGA